MNKKRKNVNYNNDNIIDIEEQRKIAKLLYVDKLRLKIKDYTNNENESDSNNNNNINNNHEEIYKRKSKDKKIIKEIKSSNNKQQQQSALEIGYENSNNNFLDIETEKKEEIKKEEADINLGEFYYSIKEGDDGGSSSSDEENENENELDEEKEYSFFNSNREHFKDVKSYFYQTNKRSELFDEEDDRAVKQNLRQLAILNPSEITPFISSRNINKYTNNYYGSNDRQNNNNFRTPTYIESANYTSNDFPSCFPQLSSNLYIDGSLASFQPLIKYRNEIKMKPLNKPFPLSVNDTISPLWFDEHHLSSNQISNNNSSSNNKNNSTSNNNKDNINNYSFYKSFIKDEDLPKELMESILKEELINQQQQISNNDKLTNYYGNTLLNIKDQVLIFASGENMNVLTIHFMSKDNQGIFPLRYDYENHSLHHYVQPQPILNIEYFKFSKRIYLIYFRTLYSVYFFYFRLNSTVKKFEKTSLEFISKTTFKEKISDVSISTRSLQLAYILLSDGSLLSLNYQSNCEKSSHVNTLLESGGDYESLRDGEWKKLKLSMDSPSFCYICTPTELILVDIGNSSSDVSVRRVQTRLLMNHQSYGILTGLLLLDHMQIIVSTVSHVLLFDTRFFDKPLISWRFFESTTQQQQLSPQPLNLTLIQHSQVNDNINLLMVHSNTSGFISFLQYAHKPYPSQLQLPHLNFRPCSVVDSIIKNHQNKNNNNKSNNNNNNNNNNKNKNNAYDKNTEFYQKKPFSFLLNQQSNVAHNVPVATGVPFIPINSFGTLNSSAIDIPINPFNNEPLVGITSIQTHSTFLTLLQMNRVGDITSTRYHITYRKPQESTQKPLSNHQITQHNLYRTRLQKEYLSRFIDKRNLTNYASPPSTKMIPIVLKQLPRHLNLIHMLPFDPKEFSHHNSMLFTSVLELLKRVGTLTMNEILDYLSPHFEESSVIDMLRNKSKPALLQTTTDNDSTLGIYHVRVQPRGMLMPLNVIIDDQEIKDPLLEYNSNVYYCRMYFGYDIPVIGSDEIANTRSAVLAKQTLIKEKVKVFNVKNAEVEEKEYKKILEKKKKYDEGMAQAKNDFEQKKLDGARKAKLKRPKVVPILKVKYPDFEPDKWHEEWIKDAADFETADHRFDTASVQPIISLVPPTIQKPKEKASKANRDTTNHFNDNISSQPVFSLGNPFGIDFDDGSNANYDDEDAEINNDNDNNNTDNEKDEPNNNNNNNNNFYKPRINNTIFNMQNNYIASSNASHRNQFNLQSMTQPFTSTSSKHFYDYDDIIISIPALDDNNNNNNNNSNSDNNPTDNNNKNYKKK